MRRLDQVQTGKQPIDLASHSKADIYWIAPDATKHKIGSEAEFNSSGTLENKIKKKVSLNKQERKQTGGRAGKNLFLKQNIVLFKRNG